MVLYAWQALYVSAVLFTYCRSDKRVKYLNFCTNKNHNNTQTNRPKDRQTIVRTCERTLFCIVLGLSGVVGCESFSGIACYALFPPLSLFLALSLCFFLSFSLCFGFCTVFVISHIFRCVFHTDPLCHRRIAL